MFGVEEVQKILVIYTGGTIGMIKEKGGEVSSKFTHIYRIVNSVGKSENKLWNFV